MLEQALATWRDWSLVDVTAKPTLVRIFTNGLNHHTGLIESAGKQYVLKVFTHSGEHAINVHRWAEQYGIAPQVYYANGRILVMQYIKPAPINLDSLAQTLAQLHRAQGQPSNATRFDIIASCQAYLQSLDSNMQNLHQQLLPALQHFAQDSTPWCACHNDLVSANCLFTQDTAVLIDWEYATQHNPWFDLAAVIYYFDLSGQQTEVFLERYQTGWSAQQYRAILLSAQIAVLWCDVLWYLSKFDAPDLSRKLVSLASLFNTMVNDKMIDGDRIQL